MLHVRNVESPELVRKLTGQYYTHNIIARQMTTYILDQYVDKLSKMEEILICDPFAGDGRLVISFLMGAFERYPNLTKFKLSLWDINAQGFQQVRKNIKALEFRGISIEVDLRCMDTFVFSEGKANLFDIILSNPPWEMLKPDRRELEQLDEVTKRNYVANLKRYDARISEMYPLSQPQKKFAGWGTNLSRVGLEVCTNLVKDCGIIGVVLPASFLADSQSVGLRKRVLSAFCLDRVFRYTAEAKLFGDADVDSVAICAKKENPKFPLMLNVSRFLQKEGKLENSDVIVSEEYLTGNEYSVPINLSKDAFSVQSRIFSEFEQFKNYEGISSFNIWAGRELDETGINKYLGENRDSGKLFIKGKMIRRYGFAVYPQMYFVKDKYKWPESTKYKRIVWRDVSRPSQKRRVIATIAEENTIAGNSLGVAFFRDGDDRSLQALLGLMSSLVFEFQLRNYLATGHISLSSLRKVRVPPLKVLRNCTDLADLARKQIEAEGKEDDFKIDAFVAKNLYQLTLTEYMAVLESFEKISAREQQGYIAAYEKCQPLC